MRGLMAWNGCPNFCSKCRLFKLRLSTSSWSRPGCIQHLSCKTLFRMNKRFHSRFLKACNRLFLWSVYSRMNSCRSSHWWTVWMSSVLAPHSFCLRRCSGLCRCLLKSALICMNWKITLMISVCYIGMLRSKVICSVLSDWWTGTCGIGMIYYPNGISWKIIRIYGRKK